MECLLKHLKCRSNLSCATKYFRNFPRGGERDPSDFTHRSAVWGKRKRFRSLDVSLEKGNNLRFHREKSQIVILMFVIFFILLVLGFSQQIYRWWKRRSTSLLVIVGFGTLRLLVGSTIWENRLGESRHFGDGILISSALHRC